jgi:hypothetical protein
MGKLNDLLLIVAWIEDIDFYKESAFLAHPH